MAGTTRLVPERDIRPAPSATLKPRNGFAAATCYASVVCGMRALRPPLGNRGLRSASTPPQLPSRDVSMSQSNSPDMRAVRPLEGCAKDRHQTYERPALKRLGTFRELTRGGGCTGSDQAAPIGGRIGGEEC